MPGNNVDEDLKASKAVGSRLPHKQAETHALQTSTRMRNRPWCVM